MRSPRGLFASIAFLLALPLAALGQMVLGTGGAAVIHGALALGSALMSFAVFDFDTPRWAHDPKEQAVLFYLYCDDVAEFRSKLIESGVEAGPVQHPFYAPRGEFRVTDPDGYALMVTHT